jgi:CheY-like chemotaxis protein/anti-sigma regulatory factor (Ser/Thr protein kinase)
MYTDMLKLRQVLFNLLGNAIKFTENGLIRVAAHRETVEERDWIEISVADSGIGIEAAALPRLFKDFAQADPSMTRRYGGAGLGLSIAREFSRLMGGEVSAASVPGEGSTFTVRLPAELEASQLVGPSAPIPELGPVLVLDEDPATGEQVQRALQADGVTVISCSRLSQGVALVRTLRPQAIVLGIQLPDLEGWALLGQLRGEVGLRSVPVLVASLLDEQGRALGLGAAAYLAKPIDARQLRSTLANLRGSPTSRT